jgi:hypothetical protein
MKSYKQHVREETREIRDLTQMTDGSIVQYYKRHQARQSDQWDRMIAMYRTPGMDCSSGHSSTQTFTGDDFKGALLLWLYAHYLQTGATLAVVRVLMKNGKQIPRSHQEHFGIGPLTPEMIAQFEERDQEVLVR